MHTQAISQCGEIGRRSGFKIHRANTPCRFESGHWYHEYYRQATTVACLLRKAAFGWPFCFFPFFCSLPFLICLLLPCGSKRFSLATSFPRYFLIRLECTSHIAHRTSHCLQTLQVSDCLCRQILQISGDVDGCFTTPLSMIRASCALRWRCPLQGLHKVYS